MTRLIDADAVMRNNLFTERDRNFLLNAPTIDAVEVVRCKDCIVSEIFQCDSNGTMERYCKAFTHLRMVADDDYCSYGERRER